MHTFGLLSMMALIASGTQAEEPSQYEALLDLPLETAMERAAEGDQKVPHELIRYGVRKALADLMYPVDLRTPFGPLDDPETVSVIREFETRAGLAADGQLTFRESQHLMRLAELSNLTPISPGMGLSVRAYEGVLPQVRASGSWSMPDIAWPLNRSEITCNIDEGRCEDVALVVSAPKLTGAGINVSSYVLSTYTDSYEIQGWRDGVLDALSGTTCRRVRLTINTRTNLVSQTTEDLDPLGCPIPGSDQRLDPIRGVRVATLIDTWEAQKSYQDTIREKVRGAHGPLGNTIDEYYPE